MERIPHVELLRAMATVGIFVFHLWSVVPHSAHGGLFGPVLARLPLLGTLGVIVFNLITGFVLSMPYLGPQHRRPLPTALDFWRRRFGWPGRGALPIRGASCLASSSALGDAPDYCRRYRCRTGQSL
jgi:hypothetical protein